MKMNMHLIRDLLIHYETFKLGDLEATGEIKLKDYTSEEILYHVALLIDGGYIVYIDASAGDMNEYFVKRLTLEGHEFLSLIEDKHIFETLSKVLKGTLQALPVLLPYIQPYIPQMLGLIK